MHAMDEQKVRTAVDAMSSGVVRHPRFTRQEVEASNGRAHDKLWKTILSLEPAGVHAARGGKGASSADGGNPQGGGGLGPIGRLATRYGRDPRIVIAERYKYLDKGVESRVHTTPDGIVRKVRRLSASNVDGVVNNLATIVYHNYLFPEDAYVLADVAVWNNNGSDEFFLVLEQPLVTPLTDADGNIIPPTYEQITAALAQTPQRFYFWSDSDEKDDSDVEAAKRIAYNEQFMVYDFQPGRNTFIDAQTGKIRFIDPRVRLNDPNAGFKVSQFGRRTKNGMVTSTADHYAEYDGYEDELDFDSTPPPSP